MAFNIWTGLIFLASINMLCDASSSKIKIGDPCGIPHGSRRWMNKNNTFWCDQCDAGEYWDSYNNTCSACTGSLTSCKPNVLSSSCSQHWRDCETTSPNTTTRNVSTDKPVINTSSNIHSTTSVEHITSPTSTKKITNANIRPITSASFQSSFTSSTTVKTSVEHSEKTHLEPWVYIIIVRGVSQTRVHGPLGVCDDCTGVCNNMKRVWANFDDRFQSNIHCCQKRQLKLYCLLKRPTCVRQHFHLIPI
uniref:uncharacterized protein LOC120340353 n=1 Tax=Styela clava TaxID=7725 RepID=UPI00193ADA0F|nr:uncharacterized protein LOC120340353 [Styela clava]